ncbi:hypothetical protein ACFQ0E_07340 [Lysobacter brunescens]|uniref:Uncharacterized protein n=1 Tax=Lysobacter brunescens TaxID=262323 RepID=A0ABW2YA41_9GAMM
MRIRERVDAPVQADLAGNDRIEPIDGIGLHEIAEDRTDHRVIVVPREIGMRQVIHVVDPARPAASAR